MTTMLLPRGLVLQLTLLPVLILLPSGLLMLIGLRLSLSFRLGPLFLLVFWFILLFLTRFGRRSDSQYQKECSRTHNSKLFHAVTSTDTHPYRALTLVSVLVRTL